MKLSALVVAVLVSAVLLGGHWVHAEVTAPVEEEVDHTLPSFPPLPPSLLELGQKSKATTKKCDNCTFEDRKKKIVAPAYTTEDLKRFMQNPTEKTTRILTYLKRLKRGPGDDTVKDIREMEHLLGLYAVLKQELVKTLTRIHGSPPTLPSEVKTYYDAAGRQWGDAQSKGGLSELLKARDKDITKDKKALEREYAPGQKYTKGLKRVDPKKLDKKTIGTKAFKKAQKKAKKKATSSGPRVDMVCCATCPCQKKLKKKKEEEKKKKAPMAPAGTPEGVAGRSQVALEVPHGMLTKKPASSVKSTPSKRSAFANLLTTPQCPCGCAVHECPCRCKGARLAPNTVAVVRNLPAIAKAAKHVPASPPIRRPILKHGSSPDCRPPLCTTG